MGSVVYIRKEPYNTPVTPLGKNQRMCSSLEKILKTKKQELEKLSDKKCKECGDKERIAKLQEIIKNLTWSIQHTKEMARSL